LISIGLPVDQQVRWPIEPIIVVDIISRLVSGIQGEACVSYFDTVEVSAKSSERENLVDNTARNVLPFSRNAITFFCWFDALKLTPPKHRIFIYSSI